MNGKLILIASLLIAVLAIVAAGSGLLLKDTYMNDTASGAAQQRGNDLIVLVLCVPLLLVSAFFAAKGSLRGRLVWTGTVFFFLYTYASQSFLTAYNHLFLVYVAAFSLSLYTFAASVLTLDVGRIKASLAGAPANVAAAFMFFIGGIVLLMWLALIVPPLMNGEPPAALETYTTLVIQALDMGVIAPMALLTGYLLLKREAWGYALASLIFIKGITLGTGVLSMAAFMAMDGIEIVIPQAIIFAVLTLGALAMALAFLGKMKAPAAAVKAAAA
ncbi:MAG: hypothetical protein A4E28_00969 [Methanocella sp. PtaU1.Bin125]|nr:MAG: hypothetical protein A4E28_00969 [Methanocella sp. PtaU1.Bin125]